MLPAFHLLFFVGIYQGLFYLSTWVPSLILCLDLLYFTGQLLMDYLGGSSILFAVTNRALMNLFLHTT